MTKAAASALAILTLVTACEEKKSTPETPAVSTAPSATPAPAPAPAPSPSAAASASAAPTGSSAAAGSTKDPNVAVKDPVAEPAKDVKAQIGGTVTLYLPKWSGTSWTVRDSNKPLGKAKEETIPGFAGPGTPAAGFVWKLSDPALKAGQKLRAVLENKSTADKAAPPKVFTLTVELVAP